MDVFQVLTSNVSRHTSKKTNRMMNILNLFDFEFNSRFDAIISDFFLNLRSFYICDGNELPSNYGEGNHAHEKEIKFKSLQMELKIFSYFFGFFDFHLRVCTKYSHTRLFSFHSVT